MKTIKIILTSILIFSTLSSFATTEWQKVACPGKYANHLQGIAVNADKIYWSYTTKILRTDARGNIEKIIDAPTHHGDCCFHEGKLYVAVNRGLFNRKIGAKNFVYVYDADLNFEKEIAIEDLEGGLGGMEFYDGSFYLVGGIHPSETHFKICKYSKDFKLEKVFKLPVLDSDMGVQTICRAYGKFWLGCYMKKGFNESLWETDDNFNIIRRHKFGGAALGIAPIQSANGANFLIASGYWEKNKYAPCTAIATPMKIETK